MEVLQTFFSKLKIHVINQQKTFFNLDDWTEDLAKELEPVLRIYYTQGTDDVIAALGGDDAFNLSVNELDKAIKNAAWVLAESTLDTTKLAFDTAIEQTRNAVTEGLDAHESSAILTDRIQEIFTDLSENRAYMIANTESTRCKANGELIAIQDSGVDCKKKWLPDGNACLRCLAMAARGAIPLDEPFGVFPDEGAYSEKQHPPRHTNCRCALVYEFDE